MPAWQLVHSPLTRAACVCLPPRAGGALTELAVRDYVCSRPLCALLPRYAALRCVALSAYSVDLDLEPLRALRLLEALHVSLFTINKVLNPVWYSIKSIFHYRNYMQVESEGLPRSLAPLPPSLRRLSLSAFVNGGR